MVTSKPAKRPSFKFLTKPSFQFPTKPSFKFLTKPSFKFPLASSQPSKKHRSTKKGHSSLKACPKPRMSHRSAKPRVCKYNTCVRNPSGRCRTKKVAGKKKRVIVFRKASS